MVRVRFLSTLREAAGTEWANFPLGEDPTLEGLLVRVHAFFGSAALGESREFQWRHSAAEPLVLLNGRQVEPSQRSHTTLADGDQVWLLPPLAGGEGQVRLAGESNPGSSG